MDDRLTPTTSYAFGPYVSVESASSRWVIVDHDPTKVWLVRIDNACVGYLLLPMDKDSAYALAVAEGGFVNPNHRTWTPAWPPPKQ